MAEDREQAIEQIVERARAVRPRTPRWLWLAGGVLGLAGAIAFVIVLVGQGDSTSAPTTGPAEISSGRGFGAGLALGVGLGISIGFVIARQLGRQLVRDHSSRSKP